VAVDGRPLPIGSFLVLFVPAAVFSYGVTIFLFLPTLLILSRIGDPSQPSYAELRISLN
jgi:hypothetical protein